MRRLFAVILTMLMCLAVATGPARADIITPGRERPSREERTPGCSSSVVGLEMGSVAPGRSILVVGVAVISLTATATIIYLARKRER